MNKIKTGHCFSNNCCDRIIPSTCSCYNLFVDNTQGKIPKNNFFRPSANIFCQFALLSLKNISYFE
jgi:hypothetical protein